MTPPMRTTVGGLPGAHVAFTVRRDVGCDSGFHHGWLPVEGGAFWAGTEVGDTIRVWIVDVGETRLYIEGATHEDAGVDIEREVERIVGSIRFE